MKVTVSRKFDSVNHLLGSNVTTTSLPLVSFPWSGHPSLDYSKQTTYSELSPAQYLESLFTRVPFGHEVVADPDEPVAVAVPLVEAVGRADEDPGGEDGGGTHEVGLATGLPEEERGQPGEAALLRRVRSFAVLVSPDDPPSPGSLVRSADQRQTSSKVYKKTMN